MKNLKFFIAISLCLIFAKDLSAQSRANTLSFGINGGGTKYWGEFTDNQFWLGGDLFLRYNLIPKLSLQASVGIGQIRWKVGESELNKFPEYFGVDAQIGDNFPNSTTEIISKNSNRLLTYELYLTYNFFSSEEFVPYIFGGVGLLNHEPRAGDTGYGGSLPNNAGGVYDKNILAIPVGAGFEYYLSDNLVFNGRATFRFTGTDYIDDLSSSIAQAASSEQDHYLTYGIGISYYILDDEDFDNDGLSNAKEEKIGTDPKVPDTDGDELSDGDEVNKYKTDPLMADTDSDGLQDNLELFKYMTSPTLDDTDSDKLIDGVEISKKTDPNKPDTDGDGLIDGEEVDKYGTDPLNIDTDEDGLSDGKEALEYGSNPKQKDTDSDGLTDGDEVNKYKTNPASNDSDSDKLTDNIELNNYKTDPNNPDSDGDGLLDGDEVQNHGCNPLLKDTDSDGISDGDEINKYKTNPNNQDTDGDRLMDGEEINDYHTDPAMADTDGDKVNDKLDDCPLVFGIVSESPGKNGCPDFPKVGTKLDFPDILFKVDSDEFNYDMPMTVRNLSKLLEYVQQCDDLQVMIEGHASSEGEADYNRKLSQRRADKVKFWLIEEGVDPSQVFGTIGFGEDQPKIDEPIGEELKKMSKSDLEKIRKQNRRITIEVKKTCRQGN